MKNKSILFLIIGIIGLFAIVLFFSKDKGKKYNWSPSLQTKNTQPYGLSVFQKSLKEKYPVYRGFNKQTMLQLEQSDEKVDYYAIGNRLHYKRNELDTLLRFVQKGNNVFLSFKYISDTALLKFGIPIRELEEQYYDAETVNVNFTHPQLAEDSGISISYHKSFEEKESFSWVYLNPVTDYSGENLKGITHEFFDESFDNEEEIESTEEEFDNFNKQDTTYDDSISDLENHLEDIEFFVDGSFFYGSDILENVEPVESITDVAYMDSPSKIICKRYKVGEGYVFILTTPIVLTNFYASDSAAMKLPAGILSHFNAESCVLDIEATNFKLDGFSLDASNTPLQYILRKKWFKIGFYTLLASAFLFIIFSTFRKQRASPVFNLPENRSIEQIKDVAASLYHDSHLFKLKEYFQDSYSFWKNENRLEAEKMGEEEAELFKRCEFLNRKDRWEMENFLEFQKKYKQLKSIYGK